MGDSAATISLGNRIDESLNGKIMAMQQWLSTHPFPGLLDCIPAYSSLTIIYDPIQVRPVAGHSSTIFEWVKQQLANAFGQTNVNRETGSTFHRVPVCYEGTYAPDLPALALEKQLDVSAVIDLHTSRTYRVFMIGFLPGFSYLGTIDERIAVGRKAQPVMVAPGSVGIAGIQTGIYPLASPGGWQIIGRTPLKLFDPYASSPVLFRTGDQVRFYPITPIEFEEY